MLSVVDKKLLPLSAALMCKMWYLIRVAFCLQLD
jgi:hypothetical protein